MPGNLRGCSRGIFGLKDWEALRRPGSKQQSGPSRNADARPGIQENGCGDSNVKQSAGGKKDPRVGRTILSKFTYNAKPDSPLGKELSTKMLEKLVFMYVCPDNEEWWMARNENGEEGYVPAKYVQMEEARPTSLPWLQNKELLESKDKKPEPEPTEKLEYKGYKSAYDKAASTTAPEPEYKCDICEKNFNGPQPYNMHMKSKAHKEQVDYYESFE